MHSCWTGAPGLQHGLRVVVKGSHVGDVGRGQQHIGCPVHVVPVRHVHRVGLPALVDVQGVDVIHIACVACEAPPCVSLLSWTAVCLLAVKPGTSQTACMLLMHQAQLARRPSYEETVDSWLQNRDKTPQRHVTLTERRHSNRT